jgi:hypothetical protein
MIGLMAVTVICLAVLVAVGKDSAVTDGLLAVVGVVGGSSLWERLTKKGV